MREDYDNDDDDYDPRFFLFLSALERRKQFVRDEREACIIRVNGS